jgi:transmembrane sensor
MSERPPTPAQEHADEVFDKAQHWDDRGAPADRAERALHARWLRASPEHVRATLEMDEIREQLSPDPNEPRRDPASILAEVAAINAEEDAELAAAGAIHLAPPPQRWWRVHPAWSAAAGVAAAVLLAGSLWYAVHGAMSNTYTTELGELRSFQLSDGSLIELNAMSRVRVTYTAERRDVELLEGEALFKVAHAPQRPFVVACAGTEVRAIGTQFRVTQYPHTVAVRVLEGTVGISQPQAAANTIADATAPATRLTRGEAARITPAGKVTRFAEAATEAQSLQVDEWRVHDEPLENIAAQMNRYNERPKIRIDDPAAAAMQFNGIYDLRAAEHFVKILEHTPGLTVERRDTDEVIVRAATPASPGGNPPLDSH